MLSKDEYPCKNNEEIDEEISTDENVELAARALMKLSQDTASSLELEGSNEEIRKLAPKRNKRNISKHQKNFQAKRSQKAYDKKIDEQDFQLTDSEETISASSTNSPSSKQSPSFESVEQSQEEINLVSMESKSQEEINLVSLESEPQKSQGSSKQLPKYPVSAKNSNKKIPIAKFIQKITTATSSDDMMLFEDRVGQLIVDGYEDNAVRTELYDEIFPLIS
ncbi:24164_t:CDS:2, partial [Racocetra persica]